MPESIAAAREVHLREAANERRKYREHMAKAKSDLKCMSMIIDGMTQKTTALPHFTRRPSWIDKLEYGVHVIGSITAGVGIHLEFSHKNIGDNTNVLIDNIHKGIVRMQQHREQRQEQFPEVLFLQLDNVSSNKSKALFTYLSFLVDQDVFKKVKVNYLMVGHTHEIIDQVFSRYSVALRKQNCLTLQELMNVAKTCYTPNPTVEHVTVVTDWWKWFLKYKATRLYSVDSSYNLAFRIKKYPVAQPEEHFVTKVYSKTYGWRNNDTDPKGWGPKGGLQQLLLCPKGKSLLKEDPEPQELKPLDDAEFHDLKDIIKGFKKNIGDAFSGDLSEYWESALEFQDSVREGDNAPAGFEVFKLKTWNSGQGKNSCHDVMSSFFFFVLKIVELMI